MVSYKRLIIKFTIGFKSLVLSMQNPALYWLITYQSFGLKKPGLLFKNLEVSKRSDYGSLLKTIWLDLPISFNSGMSMMALKIKDINKIVGNGKKEKVMATKNRFTGSRFKTFGARRNCNSKTVQTMGLTLEKNRLKEILR